MRLDRIDGRDEVGGRGANDGKPSTTAAGTTHGVPMEAGATVSIGEVGVTTADGPACPAGRRRRTHGPDRPSGIGGTAGVSARRLAANRANARKSTGPRTERGKSVSRFNALRHGLAAQTALLPGECDVSLAELTADFQADHGGGSAAERAVAGRMVSVVWKLRRLARAEEHAAADLRYERTRAWAIHRAARGEPLPADGHEFDGPDPMPMDSAGPRIVADDVGRPGHPGRVERLMLWDVRLGGELLRTCKQLVAVRKAMADDEGIGMGEEGGRMSGHGDGSGGRLVAFDEPEAFEEPDADDGAIGDDGGALDADDEVDDDEEIDGEVSGDDEDDDEDDEEFGKTDGKGVADVAEITAAAVAGIEAAAVAVAVEAAAAAAASSPLSPGEVAASAAGEGEREAARCSLGKALAGAFDHDDEGHRDNEHFAPQPAASASAIDARPTTQAILPSARAAPPAPSPGAPGEGWGGGLAGEKTKDDGGRPNEAIEASAIVRLSTVRSALSCHTSPLPSPPPAYRGREPEAPPEGSAAILTEPTQRAADAPATGEDVRVDAAAAIGATPARPRRQFNPYVSCRRPWSVPSADDVR